MQIDVESPLALLVAKELEQKASGPAMALSDAIRRERSDVASVLFYGSCLRNETNEGVFDFYVLVGRYRATYDSLALAIGNALLPPNVFYIEIDSEWGRLRAKYAVLSLAHFEREVSPSCIHPYIWARFSQPALMVYARDQHARDVATRCAAQAILTLIQRLGVFVPARGGRQQFSLAALWQESYRRTYGAERRTESLEHVRGVYDSNVERYDSAATLALVHLQTQGWFDRVEARGEGNCYEVEMSSTRLAWNRVRWQLSRPIARLLAVMRLLKTAFTFGDWVPYAVWKLERHSGETIELSERQRRHPLIFGWPVIWRVYLRKTS